MYGIFVCLPCRSSAMTYLFLNSPRTLCFWSSSAMPHIYLIYFINIKTSIKQFFPDVSIGSTSKHKAKYIHLYKNRSTAASVVYQYEEQRTAALTSIETTDPSHPPVAKGKSTHSWSWCPGPLQAELTVACLELQMWKLHPFVLSFITSTGYIRYMWALPAALLIRTNYNQPSLYAHS